MVISLHIIVGTVVLCAAAAFLAPVKGNIESTALSAGKSKSIPFMHEPPRLAGMVGDKGFDPLGFSNAIDPKFLREAELKHGRICMLAALGFVASEFVKLPGEVHNVSPLLAHDAAVASGAMTQILGFIIAIEAVSSVAVVQMMEGSDRAPGDFSLRLFGYDKMNEDKKKELQLKELENGRLAVS
jgi:light-harvesting complex I chlorophyll a/b binding protein 1